MNRAETLQRLRTNKARLTREFGVVDRAFSGAVARDEAHTGSDVDILVKFDGPATSRRYFGLLFFLEDLLNCPVDLVTDKALRPALRPHVEREAIHV